MKESYLLRFSLLLTVIALISSCKSTHFVTRKYTSGIYRESKQIAQKPNHLNTNKQVYSANKPEPKVQDFIESELDPEISLNEKSTVTIKDNIKRNFNLKKSIQAIKKESSKLKQSLDYNKKSKQNNTTNNKPETTALLGFIFAMAAILLIIAAILIYSNPYFLTLSVILFLLGLILGVVGLILGTIAKKNHKKNEGSSLDLTFSLIATIIGVLCMIALIASIIILLVALILILLIFI